MHVGICAFLYYSGRLIQLLIAEHANRLRVSTTHSALIYKYICHRESCFEELHSPTVNPGNTHTHSQTEGIQILISSPYLNATIGTLDWLGVIKL